MLWSRPERAQRPIVEGAKRTFEPAISSAASASEIQSDGGLGTAQPASCVVGVGVSRPFDDRTFDVSAGADAAPVPVSLAGLDSSASGFAVCGRARSLRAQPVPLKTTAGGANALRIGPLQFGHAEGP